MMMMQEIITLFFLYFLGLTLWIGNVIGIKVVSKYHLKECVFLTTVPNIL